MEVIYVMRLWRNIPERLVQHVPRFQIVFMAVFVAFDVIANAAAPRASDTADVTLQDLKMYALYIGLSLASCFILVPGLQQRLRSGHRFLGISRKYPYRTFMHTLYSFIYPLAIYLFIPAMLMLCTMMASSLMLSTDPSFAKSVSDHSLNLNVFEALLTALLASTEEVWRWAMITIVLLLMKNVFQRRWQSAKFRWIALGLSTVISSLLFGFGHVGEYPGYGWQTLWTLSATGFLLMLCALLTRRFMVAMLIHFSYDFIVMLDANIPDAAVFSFAVVTMVVVLLFVILFIVVRRHTNYWLERDVQSGWTDPHMVA
jgi:hypothetical protein